jgi:hypothetical protein
MANGKGTVKFYNKKDPRGFYFISADIAEGTWDGDYSHAKVLKLPRLEQIATIHAKMEPHEFGRYLARVGRHYNNAVICPERNNHGIAVINALRQFEKYPDSAIHSSRPKHHETHQDKTTRPEVRWGFLTNAETKPLIIDNLADKIRQKEIYGFPNEDFPELYSYIDEGNKKTNAASGCFDDRVMSLAIGLYVAPMYSSAIMRVSPDNNCSNCRDFGKHIVVDKMPYALCSRSRRWTSAESVCRLYSELPLKPIRLR